jgi:hypothetical protein
VRLASWFDLLSVIINYDNCPILKLCSKLNKHFFL